mmetsp:Transcript_16242/g.38873  ORF Transcript_16242/g.38873 Transcript_16242/m.38873 type:complete len:308 (-) Transcript_16242:729-1652(-)
MSVRSLSRSPLPFGESGRTPAFMTRMSMQRSFQISRWFSNSRRFSSSRDICVALSTRTAVMRLVRAKTDIQMKPTKKSHIQACCLMTTSVASVQSSSVMIWNRVRIDVTTVPNRNWTSSFSSSVMSGSPSSSLSRRGDGQRPSRPISDRLEEPFSTKASHCCCRRGMTMPKRSWSSAASASVRLLVRFLHCSAIWFEDGSSSGWKSLENPIMVVANVPKTKSMMAVMMTPHTRVFRLYVIPLVNIQNSLKTVWYLRARDMRSARMIRRMESFRHAISAFEVHPRPGSHIDMAHGRMVMNKIPKSIQL